MDESLFKKVPVKVQKKSSFDLSFQNLLTTKVGTITPVLCEEVMPNTTIDLKAAIQAQLPPLASDTFMRCDLKYEAFFVPTRLCMAGYEEWLVPGSSYSTASSSVDPQFKPKIPLLTLKSYECLPGTLADYLGVKSNLPRVIPAGGEGYNINSATTIQVNALPFLAYHRIYDDWYRNSLIQRPIYRCKDGIYGTGNTSSSVAFVFNAANSQFSIPNGVHGYIMSIEGSNPSATGNTKTFYDGVQVTETRQRNFGIDRFTSATAKAQNGDEQGLKMSVSNNEAGFTIGQLRAANSIQMWLERNNLAGNRLTDYVKANYGANLSDGVAQRAILLGSGQFAVYSKGIYQNTNAVGTQDSQVFGGENNPFANSVGAQYGSAFASGNEHIIDHFTANEPGYLFVMVTLVPKVTYATGIDRKLIRYTNDSRTDMANPLLQNTGNEPIWQTELSTDLAFSDQGLTGDQMIFGYQERYADWKSKQDEVHGLLRERSNTWAQMSGNTGYAKDVGTLSSFALQSSFGIGRTPEISSSFLMIPDTYLDDVAATKGDISKYGCWIDTYFDFKASMPLARYSMPSLQDPAYEHGEDVVLDRGGKRL